jgi:hypothetical protein
LLIYIAAWTYIVNAAAGIWSDSTLCTENETTARRKPLDEILALDALLPKADIHVVMASLKTAADHQAEIVTTEPEITHMSESLDDNVAKGDIVELGNAEATTERTETEAHESADREVETEIVSPEVTRVIGLMDNEVAKVDAVELNDAEATSEEIQVDAKEAADHEVEIETISPQITRLSGSIHDELTEGGDAVGLNDEKAKSEITRTEAARESADREPEIELTSPKIKRGSGSLDTDEAEVDDIEFSVADISLHFEIEVSDMSAIENELSPATDAEVGIITRGTVLASDRQIMPLIEERHVVDDDGRYASQSENMNIESSGSGRESNAMNTGTFVAEPPISPVINENEVIVVEFGNGTVETGREEDANNSASVHDLTDEEDEVSHAALTIATETTTESETIGGDEGNVLHTDSQKEVTNSSTQCSSLDVNDRNTAENDRIDPACEGASGESAASQAEAAFRDMDTMDQLHGRRRLPRFIAPFVTTSWMKDSAKRKQTSRFTNYLFSVSIGQAALPNSSGDSTALDKHGPSVSLTLLTGVAKNAVRHCTAFLIGVHGKYKNQVMMDALSEIWTNRFWI